FDQARDRAASFGGAAEAAKLRERLRDLFQTARLVRGTRFREALAPRWAPWEKLPRKETKDRVSRLAEERRRLLDRQTQADAKKGEPFTEAERQRLAEVNFEIDLGSFELALRDYEAEPWKTIADPERRQRSQATLFNDVINAFSLVLGQARNERLAQLR